MKVDLAVLKTLREQTDAPIGECRQALEHAQGNLQRALEYLRQNSAAIAQQKATRAASEGSIGTYLHHDGQLAALVEINCETDFVAKTGEFQQFCRNIAKHIAAMRPRYLRREEVPPATLEAETDQGTLDTFVREHCLLDQPFVLDQAQTVGQCLELLIGKLRENIIIRRFVRMQVGE
ncbi:MAG: elongation factor Ts [Candidatus Omnitrophica bacterium]|nr:elongation factor Ts [Candidatus Omnitrophota bacterium]